LRTVKLTLTANTDVGQTEGEADRTNPEGGDPPNQNTDGHWLTPSGRAPMYVGSSVQDIRLTATITLSGGTYAEDSDAAGADDRDGEDDTADAARAVAHRRSGDSSTQPQDARRLRQAPVLTPPSGGSAAVDPKGVTRAGTTPRPSTARQRPRRSPQASPSARSALARSPLRGPRGSPQ
jgi:hypothetical protein